MPKYNESRKKASIKYAKNHIRRVPFDVQKDEYERIKAFAESKGETINGMIKRLLRQEMGDFQIESENKT